MSDKRHIDKCESRWSISCPTVDDPTLIVCPKCSSKGVVIPSPEGHLKAVCAKCGFSAVQPEGAHGFYWQDDNPTDGYFGYNLWLQTNCAGNSLWAFNIRHLELLESYVGAKLRQRTSDEKWGWQNSSLTSRLPKWMKNGKSRDSILNSLAVLRKKSTS